MKYIISTFSPKIFSQLEGDFDLKWHRLTEDEFHALMLDGYSCVGYEDVATMLNVAHNPEPVKARADDTLLLADLNNKTKTMEYWCIQVCPSDSPLLRSEELDYIEEEMI